MPSRQPRKPSIGLNSCSSWTRCAIFSAGRRSFRRDRPAAPCVVRQEFVQRRIEETDRGRVAFQRLEDADEIFALIGQAASPGAFLRSVDVVGEDHLAHGVDAVAFEEHVLGAGRGRCRLAPKAMAFSVCSGVSALVRTSSRATFEHHFMSWLNVLNLLVFCVERLSTEHAGDDLATARSSICAGINLAGGAVDGEVVAFA